jgi:hypothetical protein
MGKLDPGQGDGRGPERLEASHRGTPAFDCSMILLNEIVEILGYISPERTSTSDPRAAGAEAPGDSA